ncbi:MAG TPA: PadR family transcriptional regulator [Actinocrinis sp.]|jgi:DNA-binding PadR family transcriptional regulator
MARWDLVGTTVLALLTQRPRHPYDMHRFVLDTHKDYIVGLPRSLYHAIDRLERDGMIEPAETSREGRGPERTIYRITAEGREELAHRVRRMLEHPDSDSAVMYAGLSIVAALPVSEAERSLQARAARVEGVIATLDAVLAGLDLPRVLLLEADYARALRAAELAWLRSALADLRSGALAWPDPKMPSGEHAENDTDAHPEPGGTVTGE